MSRQSAGSRKLAYLSGLQEGARQERASLREKVEGKLAGTPEQDKAAMRDWEIDDYIIAARRAALREVLALLAEPGETSGA